MLGLVISLILVFVVNPQSFHWTMQLHLPWPLLASVAGGAAGRVRRHRAGVGPPGAVGRPDARCQGGLVMRFILGLLLSLLTLLACQRAPNRPRSPPSRPAAALAFPHDYGAHPEFQTEWWYVTGWVETPDGKPLGFQVTFFRSRHGHRRAPTRATSRPRQLIIGHAALSDPAVGQLLHDQRSAREGFGLAYAKAGDTDVKLDDWRMVRDSRRQLPRRRSRSNQLTLELRLRPTQPVLLQGQGGYSRKGPQPAAGQLLLQRAATGTSRAASAARGRPPARSPAAPGSITNGRAKSSTRTPRAGTGSAPTSTTAAR